MCVLGGWYYAAQVILPSFPNTEHFTGESNIDSNKTEQSEGIYMEKQAMVETNLI